VATHITDATKSFERWLGERRRLRRDDLDFKHQQMAADTFSFLRATFYRWAELWPEELPEVAEAPKVLAVGDLHVENYGTWRDVEGRLVWGVNDFDEATNLPYTLDLVRLATSAGLAATEGHLTINLKEACAAILSGYTSCLKAGGRPMVLAENDRWLRKLASGRLRDPVVFWSRITALPTARGPLPSKTQEVLLQRLPDGAGSARFVRRRAGLGSLGLERLVAVAGWNGGMVAHEAKALAPSAWDWAHASHTSDRIHYLELIGQAVRCPDPMVDVREGWLVRRLSPDCGRVMLDELPKRRDEARLLKAMGWEAGNIHLGTRGAGRAIVADLARRKQGWLRDAATRMARRLRADWKDWRAARSS
ncbi:MAG TPA: DUF2252 family protein, partial [Candidatus Sulfotelmatobacter sp.]|nr:DUF2252 family protein [Candidatus Sulfotelmatobacter sp.]